MTTKRLVVDGFANSCYFRTSVADGERKALVQITERCNLHCAHCFVSSTKNGIDISLDDITMKVIPRLAQARVSRVTLTGGEPFAHPHLFEICEAFVERGMSVGICTNATLADDALLEKIQSLDNVHFNVSFDGFRPESHGKFRGNRSSFDITLQTTRLIASMGMLQGLLSTPNMLTRVEEFSDLCEFAVEIGAEYVLMNPLSSFGRGVKSQGRMAAPDEIMSAIRNVTSRFADKGLDTVHIRFPNEAAQPLAGCDAGKLIYVFSDGLTAVCPYLVFAARTPQSQHSDKEFLVGNILDESVAPMLDSYDMSKLEMGTNSSCASCAIESSCGKGCPAAVISNGGWVGEVDKEQCAKPLLQIGRRP